MKKFFILIVVILCSDLLSQNIKAKYIAEVKIDYDKILESIPIKYKNQYSELLKSEASNGIILEYSLIHSDDKSIFELMEKIDNSQSQEGLIYKQIASMDKFPKIKTFNHPYYYYQEVYLGSKKFSIKEEIEDLKWSISNRQKKISGYDVIEANGIMMDSIPVTAWYTPSVNIKDGPSSLVGLPGLIVKAEYSLNNTHVTYLLKDLIYLKSHYKISIPSKDNFITQKQFLKEVKILNENILKMTNNGVDTK